MTDEEGNVTETRWYPVVDRNQEEYDLLPDEIKAIYEKNEETGGMFRLASIAPWKGEVAAF